MVPFRENLKTTAIQDLLNTQEFVASGFGRIVGSYSPSVFTFLCLSQALNFKVMKGIY